jgi:hypothetical protein
MAGEDGVLAALLAASGLALLAGAGCGPTDVLGRNVTQGNDQDVGDLVWSADGTEIFFVSGLRSVSGRSSIRAAAADGSGVRVVDAAHDLYDRLWAPADGSAVYFDAPSPDGATAGIFDVIQGAQVANYGGGVATFVASPDHARIAAFDGRSLQLFALGGSWSTIPLDPGNWTVAFSPAGDSLLIVDLSEARTIDLSGAQLATVPLDLALNWTSVAWTAEGIHVASGTGFIPSDYRVQNLTTGADLHLAVDWWSEGVGWSPDAGRVALWGNHCTGYSGFSCASFRSDLYVADTATGQTTHVASGDGLGTTVAFSPDGARLAYVLGQSIYVGDVD